MKNNKRFLRIFQAFVLGFIAFFIFHNEVSAQFSLSAEFNSRYVWRGFDFGNSPSIQPELTFTSGGLVIGAWAAYATNGAPAGTEIDWFASYTFDTSAGEFSLSVTDYTFPDDPVSYLSDEAHYIELGLDYSTQLSDGVGLFLGGGVFIHNDDDNSVYNEIGIEFEVEEISLTLFSGFSPLKSQTYGNSTFAFINTGLSTSKEVKLSDYLSADISTSLIANPHARTMFFVFGFGVGF